jgi:hypothetical protein
VILGCRLMAMWELKEMFRAHARSAVSEVVALCGTCE